MGALARRDWDEALACVRPSSDTTPWTAVRIKAELGPYFAVHANILTTPVSRAPRNTVIQPLGPRLWDVQQRLLDPEGDEDWAIVGHVDLTEGVPVDDSPIVELVRIAV
jgi:hypothetical protein